MSYMPKFKYLEPETIGDACSLLAQYGEKARALAGGTDLLVKMKRRMEAPEYLVSLNHIGHLRYIDCDTGDVLRIGALTRISDLAASPAIRQDFSIIAEAAGTLASCQIRNMGTVGGNLCNASPAADTAGPLIGLGGQAKVTGPAGERIIPLEEYFVAPGRTVLRNGEILTEIQVPTPRPGTVGVYLKLAPREKDLATVAIAAVIVPGPRGVQCRDARIVLTAVAPTVMRSFKAEGILKGRQIDDEAIEEAARAASDESRPISDIRASAEYRRDMVKVLTRRAIKQVLALAKSRRSRR